MSPVTSRIARSVLPALFFFVPCFLTATLPLTAQPIQPATQPSAQPAVTLALNSITRFPSPNPIAIHAWQENKFSMFIHYGLYSVLGGVWEGKPISKGLSEQIQAHAGIYSDTYAHTANSFNPQNWNADSIALLAKAAGMRSIIITSKHHDGFCMFHTATTDFNVVDATPFKRDILQELSAACKRQGLRFGVYFSLIDWHYPEAAPISSHNSDIITPEHFDYNKRQVTELMTNYGPISEIWFDMGSQSADESREMADLVHRLQPDCMISSRIGNDQGDFTVMGDNQEPDYRIGVPWQSPASFFDETWGYRSWQVRGNESDKVKEKLASLIRVVSQGGNYLLNIGPRGDGSVVDFEKHVLLTIGQWLQKNSEAIYGTSPDPFDTPFPWGSITTRPGKLYLHLLNPPKVGIIEFHGVVGSPKRVYTLGETGSAATGSVLVADNDGLGVQLPADYNEGTGYKVIVVEFDGDYAVRSSHTIPAQRALRDKKPLILDHRNAFKYFSNSTIDYNSRYTSTIKESWTLDAGMGARYTPVLYYSAGEKGKEITLQLNTIRDNILLDKGEKIPLKNDTASLKRSPLWLAGPFGAGIDGLNGPVQSIDPAKPWPSAAGQPWLKLTTSSGSLPADMTTAYYLLQEIASPKEQSVLIHITSGDGVLVLLNGNQLLVHNNPLKKTSMEDILLLPLKKGNNQLLIKLFNNFKKEIPFSLGLETNQSLYRLRLGPPAHPPLLLEPGKLYPISWQLAHPRTPHEELDMPNLSLKLE